MDAHFRPSSDIESEGNMTTKTPQFDRDSTAQAVIAGQDLSGRTAIVTGGASGIGIETVRALASAGASVTIAARDRVKAKETADEINSEIGTERVSWDVLDLADLASVRAFAKRWEDRPLSLLINNAGVMACPHETTADGFETQLGTNHLGHFLLTKLLTPSLEKGAPSRVISLSSSAHMMSPIDFDDPQYHSREYHPFKAYGQSKTANALFAVEYDRRHKDQGIRAFSVMPGMIVTNLGRHMTFEAREAVGYNGSPPPEFAHVSKSIEQGAATSVWAATAPELEDKGGLYLENCAEALPFSRDLPRGTGVMPHALDPEAARKLWDLSEEWVRNPQTA